MARELARLDIDVACLTEARLINSGCDTKKKKEERRRREEVSLPRHSVAVTEEGVALTWGWNGYGQLGHGDTVGRDRPTVVDHFLRNNLTVVDVFASHTFLHSGGTQRHCGAFLNLSPKVKHSLKSWEPISDRVLTARLSHRLLTSPSLFLTL